MIGLALPPDKTLSFHAGQYTILKIPIGEESVDRPFSIASSPYEKQRVEILAKLIPGGVASTFFEAIPLGASVRITAPQGNFQVVSLANPIRFIASGTGLAPFRSMIAELLDEERTPPSVRLDFITPSAEEVILADEFKKISAQHPKFYYSVVTDLPKYFSAFRQTPREDIYLCGGIHFVEDMAAFFSRQGVQPEQIHFEKFT